MNKNNVMEKIKTILGKCKWLILGIIFLYPFYCLLLGKILNFGELYTFELSLKDFMTIWIALGGIIGVVFNINLMQKRVTVMERQYAAQQKQQEDQQKRWEKQDEQQEQSHREQREQFVAQLENQQKQLLHSRFSAGVELLGNPNESARIGGAYNLYFLASENPEYVKPACKILCAQIRTITHELEYQKKYEKQPSNEIQTILDLLFKKHDNGKLIFDVCEKDLERVFLAGASLKDTILSDVNFNEAALSDVDFTKSILRDVKLWRAILSNVTFSNATLSNVTFSNATLSNVIFLLATLRDVTFSNATLKDIVSFSNANLRDVDFMDAKLSNIDFYDAKFEGYNDFLGTPLDGQTPDELTNYGCLLINKV